MTHARNRYTGEVEFVLHEEGVKAVNKHVKEWFPQKNITVTNQMLEIDDVFEEDGSLRMLLLYVERHGEIQDAYIQIGLNQRIEDVKGKLYLCEYNEKPTVSLLKRAMEKELLQKSDEKESDHVLLAFFALFNAMKPNREIAI